jgi:hypothetical protein
VVAAPPKPFAPSSKQLAAVDIAQKPKSFGRVFVIMIP